MSFTFKYPLSPTSTSSRLPAVNPGLLMDMDGIRERSQRRLVVGRSEAKLCSSSLHRLQRLVACVTAPQYEPYVKPRSGEFGSDWV